jgi:hypothetical protein
MLSGLQQRVYSALGLFWSGIKSRARMISLSASKGVSGPSLSTAGMISQLTKLSTLPEVLPVVPMLQLPFNLHNSSNVEISLKKEPVMSNIFDDLASLAASEVFPPVMTLVNSTLADIQANPQEWINPASATVKGTAFVANLVATLPTIENAAVPAAAQLVSALLTTLSSKLTAASATVNPTSVGQEIGNTIISKT